MNRQQFQGLKVGDLVRHRSGGAVLAVTSNYGDHVTAVDTRDLTNPPEWELVSQAQHDRPSQHCGSFEHSPEGGYE